MKFLMVDDEMYALKGIMDSVDWSILQFEEVLMANSYSQAVNLFNQHEIAILLCDIEMPMGNGLELVEWVGKNSPDTVCIILSCHDEFSFAKRAISLRCQDYLLKPVDPNALVEVLLKAKAEYLKGREQKLYLDYGKRYVEGQDGRGENETEMRRDVVEDTAGYIKQHLDEKLTVEELARRVYVSPDHLSRSFKKRFGKSLLDYITNERMTLAAEMLKSANLYSIGAVSAKVGYYNYAYFTRQFKKTYGVTPSEYQNKFRNRM